MPDPTAPTYSHHNPSHRDSVIGLADAVYRLHPGARVDTSHAGPTAAWVQRVRLPFGEVALQRAVVITLELDGWEAYDMSPIPSANRGNLISVIHDAFAYIHNRTHALGA